MFRERISGVRIAAVLSVVLGWSSFVPAVAQETAKPVFRVTPVRPVAELRAEALKAKPPKQKGKFEHSRLVDITLVDSSIRLDIRYATANNFLGQPVYEQARAVLREPAAEALKRVDEKVHRQGYGLLVYDAYRPWYVTKIFWEATPKEYREYVADPAEGSRHNRGCAVDLTLYELKSGKPVAMPTGFDEMSPKAYADFEGATAEEKEHRRILREAMESEGFAVLPNEWWHFDYKGWERYEVENVAFNALPPAEKSPVYRVGGSISPPRLISHAEPQFTEEARRKKVQGIALLRIVVDELGNVSDVAVERALGAGLDEEAVKTVKLWKFEPATKDGRPIRVELKVEINFHRY